MAEEQIGINLNLSMDEFDGCFANMFQLATFDGESRLDCVYVDKGSRSESGELTGKVVARINMTTQAMFELRDLLNRHIENANTSQEASNAD